MKKQKEKKDRLRGRGFGILTGILKIFIRKPKFVYIGEEIKEGSIILSNHVGKSAPLTYELYLKTPFRFWGAHEMNDGLKALYKYQSEVFYHQKQHWNIHAARAFCLIAAPLTYIFYKGLNLISTYKDARCKYTIQESVKTLKKNRSVLIFPEDSTEGYFDTLRGFFPGFVLLSRTCLKKGIDVPIYVTYFRKKDKTVIVDKPIMFSQLVAEGKSQEEIAQQLCDRANIIKDYNGK